MSLFRAALTICFGLRAWLTARTTLDLETQAKLPYRIDRGKSYYDNYDQALHAYLIYFKFSIVTHLLER